ncbi:MAG TPA: NUDIX domain-containing protein [Rubrobacteraceae bacterium]|nr:NUDIX domain-containing protein [Rubrobacteraceae bacterium]
MDERIDILDEWGRPTGEVAWKSEAHRLGLWHRCFHCWIAGSDDDGPYLLVQRRAAVKDTWPGYLDVTAAGHLGTGEEPVAGGLRELEEELGLRVDPARLIPLGTRRVEQEIPAGRDREFHEVYILQDSTPPGDLRLQREEVASVVRVGLGDAERLLPGRTAPAREFADGGSGAITVSLSNFVPHEDDYLRRVAQASLALLAGESVGRPF